VKRLLFLVLLIALFGLASCKHATTSTAVTCTTSTSTASTTTSTSTCTDPLTNISVTIAPATVSVNVVTTQQFLDSIQGGTNNVTIWQVNTVTGGNDKVGRIDSNGLYHAPVTVPSPATVNVTAVSFEDQKVSATSAVTITPAPVVTINSPSCTNTSASPAIPACVTPATSGTGKTVTFTATETGGSTNTILWYVGPVGGLGVLGGNATLGTINASGVYSSPLTPPIGQTVTVTAAAQDAPTSTASLNVTISNYSTSSLQGEFAFSMAGNNTSGHFFRAGSFVADGAGHLSSVLEDVNSASGATTTPISTTGTYTVSTDGRGTLQFSDGLTPASFNFVLVNGTQLQIIGFDTTGTATGQANAQDSSTFGASALNGAYVFDFAGTHNSNGISEIGEFTSDGAGHITGGSIDVNDNGALSQLQITGNTASVGQPPSYPSSYTPPTSPNGRGTLTLATSGATLHFSFYVVSRGAAKFVGTDSETAIGAFAGVSTQQAPNAAFDQTSLNGNYAFRLAGSGSGGTYSSAGSFSADGHGNITSIVLDENLNGTPSPNVVLTGVNYTVTSNGRGTATFGGGRTYVFYLGATGNAFFQETDSIHPNIASDGTFAKQQNTSFALLQIAGTYAFDTTGLSGASAEVIAGELTTDGSGGISAGAIDINTAGNIASGVGITPATNSFSTSSSAERGTLILNLGNPLNQTRNFAVYVVSPTQVFIVEIDSGRLATGALLRQF
jgi:hypothetical protein